MPEEKNNQPNTSTDVNTDVDTNKTPEAAPEVSQTSVSTTTSNATESETATEVSQPISSALVQGDAPATPSEVSEPVSPVSTDSIKTETEEASTTDASATAAAGMDMKPYFWAVIAIAVIGVGLLFALEKQGRVSTNFFGGTTTSVSGPAATVNGVGISYEDFERNYDQVVQNAQAQGAPDVLDETMVTSFRRDAIESLVNAELLYQVAEGAGAVASDSDIDNRITLLEERNNGPEGLATLMAEFDLTMEKLREDIRREMTIMNHLEATLDLESVTVSDEELIEIYEQIVAENPDQVIPPFAEIRDALEPGVREERQQQLIGAYIEELRQSADIQINV